MRHVLCAKCMEEKQPGERLIYPRSAIGEPAEFERVVVGVARVPTPDQRYIGVNGIKYPLPMGYFDCDLCDAPIKPGEPCGCRTVWTEETGPIGPWEDAYIIPDWRAKMEE